MLPRSTRITTEMALRDGMALATALNAIEAQHHEGDDARHAHNVNPSTRISLVRNSFAEAARTSCAMKNKHCTMQLLSTNYCPPARPRTASSGHHCAELHLHLFNEFFEGAHQALVDVQANLRCYFELRRRGVIS